MSDERDLGSGGDGGLDRFHPHRHRARPLPPVHCHGSGKAMAPFKDLNHFFPLRAGTCPELGRPRLPGHRPRYCGDETRGGGVLPGGWGGCGGKDLEAGGTMSGAMTWSWPGHRTEGRSGSWSSSMNTAGNVYLCMFPGGSNPRMSWISCMICCLAGEHLSIFDRIMARSLPRMRSEAG